MVRQSRGVESCKVTGGELHGENGLQQRRKDLRDVLSELDWYRRAQKYGVSVRVR